MYKIRHGSGIAVLAKACFLQVLSYDTRYQLIC